MPLFAGDRVFIGDHWGLPDVLAAHYGVGREDRALAFLATRAWMSGARYALEAAPELRGTLEALQAAGARLAALSNSPAETVDDVLRRLGVRDLFASVLPSSNKPAGLIRFLQEHGAGERVLCVGDHYVNEIASALLLGCHALYIDRHRTGLGAANPSCSHVGSIGEALAWLRAHATIHDR
jgi:putative hydrolase of the HAD superfamily